MADKKKIKFFPVEVDYKVVDNKSIVHIYGRTNNGEQICVIDKKFKPYFYVVPEPNVKPDKLAEEIKETKVTIRNNIYLIEDIKIVKKKIGNEEKEILQVFTNLPHGVTAIREAIKNKRDVEHCFEYNILFARRYLIDKKIIPLTLCEVEGDFTTANIKVPVFEADKITSDSEDTLEDPKVLALDIETYNPTDEINADENAIIMVGLYGKNLKKVITWKRFKTDEEYITFMDSELEMLEEMSRTIDKYRPDMITGYFSDGFDLPYIKKRAEKYKLNLKIGLDNSEIRLRGRENHEASITGIAHIDILNFIKRIISRKMKTDSFSLNNVANELIGEGKKDIEISGLAKAWDNKSKELEEYCKYNLKDAEITYKLFEKILPNIIEIVKIIGLKPFDATRMGFGQLVENYLLRMAPEFNIVAPNKPNFKETMKRQSESYTGAFVLEPKPGLYKDIILFDFRSLYPTIISSHNISPETLNCNCCREKENVPLGDETKEKKKPLWFCKKKKGFVSSMIGDIITRRQRVKEILKKTEDKSKALLLDARQETLKVLSNSFYGYLGFTQARWYSNDAAMSVTAYARDYIHKVIDTAEKRGFKVLYSDTDSIFITLDGKKKEDAIKFADEINKDLPGLMELEYEGDYRAGIFVSAKSGTGGAKKRYALIDNDNNLVVKGFETVRRNASFIAKEVQEKVLKTVLAEDNPEKAFDYVKKTIKKVKAHEIPIEKMIVVTQLTKDIEEYEAIGPHVAIAKKMREKGQRVVPGMMIKFIIGKGNGRIRDKARMVDECKKEDYDPNYYLDNQILPAVEKIFEVLGYTKEDLTGEKKQSKLESFF